MLRSCAIISDVTYSENRDVLHFFTQYFNCWWTVSASLLCSSVQLLHAILSHCIFVTSQYQKVHEVTDTTTFQIFFGMSSAKWLTKRKLVIFDSVQDCLSLYNLKTTKYDDLRLVTCIYVQVVYFVYLWISNECISITYMSWMSWSIREL